MNYPIDHTDTQTLALTDAEMSALAGRHIRTLTEDQVFDLTLQDAAGTGYCLRYRRGSSTLTFRMLEKGRVIWGEDVEADAHSIEFMLTTARSVGQAIEDDEAEGEVACNFVDGFANVADLLHMNFRLADPTSNAYVLCALDLVDQDNPEYYGLGVDFTLPSAVLRKDSQHLEALLY